MLAAPVSPLLVEDVFETFTHAFVVFDHDLRYLYANAAARRLTGSDDMVGKRFGDLVPGSRETLVGSFYKECLLNGHGGEIQVFFPPHDAWYLARANICPQGLGVAFLDITAIKAREEEANRAGAIQRALIASAGLAIVATDSLGTITEFNRAAETMLGYLTAEMVGLETPLKFSAPQQEMSPHTRIRERIFSAKEALDAFMGTRLVATSEWTLCRKDGRPVPVAITLSRILDEDSRPEGYVGVFVDLTTRNSARRALEKTRDEALQLAETKSRFLANMSHEIRTPLNGVMGVADMLEDTDLDAHQQHLVGTIRSAGTTLLRVLNDILDVSKMEAGKLSVDPVATDLAQEMQETLALFQPGAQLKGIRLESERLESLPTGMIDGTRLRQIVGNLLSNAVKFTDKGKVTLSAAVDDEYLRLKVTDTGRGISAENQEKVFESFVQADGQGDSLLGGTGLGLTLVRRMTELMGGRVRLESTPNVGTVVSLRFPLVRVGSPAENDAGSIKADVSGLRVLVAEDNTVNAMVATAQLKALGCESSLVGDGAAALVELGRNPYDVVLMDVHMPVMDGHAATRAIRAMGNPIRIVALTASALRDERVRCLESGMDDVLTKPFSRAELANLLRGR